MKQILLLKTIKSQINQLLVKNKKPGSFKVFDWLFKISGFNFSFSSIGFKLGLTSFCLFYPANVFSQENFIDCSSYSVPDFGPILKKSINLARQSAERANGGLSKYRAESWTQSGKPPLGTCLFNLSERSLSLSILGGKPGWQQFGEKPTTKSLIRIYPYEAEARIVFDSNTSF